MFRRTGIKYFLMNIMIVEKKLCSTHMHAVAHSRKDTQHTQCYQSPLCIVLESVAPIITHFTGKMALVSISNKRHGVSIAN